MTSKEKAKELVWMYLPILDGWTNDTKTKLAKQCALICVDEILNTDSWKTDNLEVINNYIDYWVEVKNEIELL